MGLFMEVTSIPRQIEVNKWKVGYVIIKIILMLIKFIYLLRSELTLTKLESCSLSRRIGFPDRARIIEFGFKVRGAVPQYLVVGF